MTDTGTNTQRIKAVVFDMAGTTVDEGKKVYDCVRKTLQKYDLYFSLDEIMESIGGMNKKEGIKKMMLLKWESATDEQLDEAAAIFTNMVEEAYRTSNSIKEMPGASDLFAHLRKNDVKVILDTGYARSTADLLISKMGWDDRNLIDFSVTSDEVSQGRPSPMMIEKALTHFNIDSAREVAKVGDTRSDVEEGLNAGCRYVVGMISSQYTEDEMLAMGATHAISSLGELKEIVTT
ncbi:HAD-IA family hydrolase [Fulvivirgaceae bacterium BMA12]|uniref:HAD-IA family hydrolase n=1 Tax=Agaribacillus aureus TaxID=3051825 RepID=A0ABT8L7J9_9BACT|nr:HAD-IA family hydrolase [Fulvivirgaceae bacterium BMA12]